MSHNANKQVVVHKGANPVIAFQDEMNRLFHNFFGGPLMGWNLTDRLSAYRTCPPTDVTETDKSITITTELPGIDAKDISVQVHDGYVTIKGQKEEHREEETKGYLKQERSYGEFQRVIALPPETSDTAQAEAMIAKGILTITVPKKANAKPVIRQLDIKQAA